jgi:alkylhydroperoxidase/carboxymuconolactone decarboxylase family protein YurZ
MNETRDLLRQLAAHDERSVQALVTVGSEPRPDGSRAPQSALDRRTRVLVVLAGLLVADAGIASLRWAVELAAATGISDETLVSVLLTAGSAAGAASTVTGAARLAQALDVDPVAG